jgi:hypothetical protein
LTNISCKMSKQEKTISQIEYEKYTIPGIYMDVGEYSKSQINLAFQESNKLFEKQLKEKENLFHSKYKAEVDSRTDDKNLEKLLTSGVNVDGSPEIMPKYNFRFFYKPTAEGHKEPIIIAENLETKSGDDDKPVYSETVEFSYKGSS